MLGLINLNPFIACLGPRYFGAVPPDVLLVKLVNARVTCTKLGD